jgi:hypothetical protein
MMEAGEPAHRMHSRLINFTHCLSRRLWDVVREFAPITVLNKFGADPPAEFVISPWQATPNKLPEAVARYEEGGEWHSLPSDADTVTVQAQPATEFINKGRKHGPRPDYKTASRVAEVVARVAPDGDWRSRLDDVCEALDKEKIPCPKEVARQGPDLPSLGRLSGTAARHQSHPISA